MRIAGYIEHAKYKITILHMNLRYAVKFESGGIEQTYKIRESETVTGTKAIEELITPSVLDKIDVQFKQMEEIRIEILQSSLNPDEEFEEII